MALVLEHERSTTSLASVKDLNTPLFDALQSALPAFLISSATERFPPSKNSLRESERYPHHLITRLCTGSTALLCLQGKMHVLLDVMQPFVSIFRSSGFSCTPDRSSLISLSFGLRAGRQSRPARLYPHELSYESSSQQAAVSNPLNALSPSHDGGSLRSCKRTYNWFIRPQTELTRRR